jgi:hypothetical protein
MIATAFATRFPICRTFVSSDAQVGAIAVSAVTAVRALVGGGRCGPLSAVGASSSFCTMYAGETGYGTFAVFLALYTCKHCFEVHLLIAVPKDVQTYVVIRDASNDTITNSVVYVHCGKAVGA